MRTSIRLAALLAVLFTVVNGRSWFLWHSTYVLAAPPQNPPQGGQNPTPPKPQTRLPVPAQTTKTIPNTQRTGPSLQGIAPPPPPLKGWVDLHAHLMGHLGFGGKLLYGGLDASPTGGSWLPADTTCVHNTRAATEAQALGHDNSTHGGYGAFDNQCGNSIRANLISALQGALNANNPPSDSLGYPTFSDWPKWNDLTHQRMWVEWIRRAYQGGLRVMVALAVNNKTLGDLATVASTDGTQVPPPQPGGAGVPGPAVDLPTDDKTSADIQIDEIKKFVARHSDFMEVALSSNDLYRIVSGNPAKNVPPKVAVVIGMEVDHIGNFQQVFYPQGLKTPMSQWGAAWVAAAQPISDDAVMAEIDRLYGEGVRYLFPIHLLDNAFGGTATYVELFNVSTERESGHPWSLVCTNNEIENISWTYDNTQTTTSVILGPFNLGTLGVAAEPLCPDKTYGQKNIMGLTSSGRVAIREMMRLGMLIDIDHMSQKSADQALQLACYGNDNVSDVSPYPQFFARNDLTTACPFAYPMNSGHSGPRGVVPGTNNERSMRPDQYAMIAYLHGMAGVGSAKLPADQWLQLYTNVIKDMQGDPTFAKPYDAAVAAAPRTSVSSPTDFWVPSGGVAAGFGADFNGLEFAMPPRSQILGGPGPQYSEYRACIQAAPCSYCDRNHPGCVLCTYAFGMDQHVPTHCDATCKQKYPNAAKVIVPGPSLQYTIASGAFPQSTDGPKSWNYNTDGVAHYGMLWDFLEDVRTLPDTSHIGVKPCPICPPNSTTTDPTFGKRMVDNNFMYGADYFYHTWQIAEGRSKCVQGVDQSGMFINSTCVIGASTQQAPVITSEPANNVVVLGQSARFAVTASGAAPLNYQWRRNGTPISGATSPNYVTSPVTPSDLGAQFTVVVSNSGGSVASSTATIFGQLSATISSKGPSYNSPVGPSNNSPVTNTVTVTSGGAPIAGVTITVVNSTYVTNASGVVVMTHSPCVKWLGPVPKPGDTKISPSIPVPCNWTGTASKPGYQTIGLTLP